MRKLLISTFALLALTSKAASDGYPTTPYGMLTEAASHARQASFELAEAMHSFAKGSPKYKQLETWLNAMSKIRIEIETQKDGYKQSA
jgi:hypothetical protein